MVDRETEDKSPKEEFRVKTFYSNLTSEVDTHFARALSMTAIQAQSPSHSKSKSPSPSTSPGIENVHMTVSEEYPDPPTESRHYPLTHRTPSPDNSIRSYSPLIHSSPPQWQHTRFHHPLSAPPSSNKGNIVSPPEWQHTRFHHPLSAPPSSNKGNIVSPPEWQYTRFHHPLSAPPGNKGNIVFPEFVKFLVQPEVDPYRNGLPMLPGQSDSPPPTYRWKSGKRGSEIATPPFYNQLHTMPEASEYNLSAQPDWYGDVDTRREERFTELDLSDEGLIEFLDNQ